LLSLSLLGCRNCVCSTVCVSVIAVGSVRGVASEAVDNEFASVVVLVAVVVAVDVAVAAGPTIDIAIPVAVAELISDAVAVAVAVAVATNGG
jgi:hypothetical protein